MGLDDFTTDDNKTSSTTKSSSTVELADTTNTPGFGKQVFTDDKKVSPRAIRYQIKTFKVGWVKQFSTQRIDEGEIVYYASTPRFSDQDLTVAVFTSILSAFDNPKGVEQTDIMVCVWDKERNEITDHKETIKPDGDWQDVLYGTIDTYISYLEDN